MKGWHNWAGTVTATPTRFERPETESELAVVVTAAAERGDTIRVAGSGHSFSPVVPTDDVLVSLERFRGLVDVDREAGQVTVRAGTTLADLNADLNSRELALSNLGDIDRQTVAGALATGTHGTGLDFGVLATQVAGIRFLTADGRFHELGPDDGEDFRAAQVSLGALGVVTELTLDVEPAYDLCLRRRTLPLDTVLDNVEAFHDAHRQWEFFWFPHTDRALVKTFDAVGESPADVIDGRSGGVFDDTLPDVLATAGTRLENAVWDGLCRLGTRYPETASASSRLATVALSEKTVVGPSHDVFANPRDVRFDEVEYGVPAVDLPAVVREIREYVEETAVPVQFPIECRFVGGDEPLLSPAHGRDTGFVAVHTYHRKDLPEHFEACEAVFDDYDGRPHWGKRHSKAAGDLASLYPEWDTFQKVRETYDPDGVFLNDHLTTVLVEDES